MDNDNLLTLIGAALGGAALGGGLCAWWFGRQVAVLRKQVDKTKHAAAHALKSARRQVRQMEKEATGREAGPAQAAQAAPAMAAVAAGRPSTEADKAAEKAAEIAARKAELERSFDQTIRVPSSGFADTQPMQ